MSKLLRYGLLCAIATTSLTSLHASESMKRTGNFIGESVARVALIPYHIVGLPFAIAGELLFGRRKHRETPQPKALPAPQPTPQPTPTTPMPLIEEPITPPGCSQTIGSHPEVSFADTSQVTEPIDIPAVLKTVMSGLPQKTDHPVYINLNLNNQQAAATARTNKRSTSPSRSPLPPKPSWLSVAKEFITHKTTSVATWIYENKFKCAALCGISIYGGIQLYLWRMAQKLSEPDCWSKWKQICSLNDLYQTKQDELLKSILSELKQAYHDDNHMNNAERFIAEANKELTMLRGYQRALARIDWWRLSWFTFVSRSSLNAIPERIQRLEFMKNTVVGWLEEHKKTHSYRTLFAHNTDPQS